MGARKAGRRSRRRGAGRPDGRKGRQGGGLREWVKLILQVVVIFFVLRTFVAQGFVITSGSMKETLLVGDFVVVNRMAIGSQVPFTDMRIPGYSEPRRGDVLVFDPHHEDTLTLVKRLVGMPGDTVEMRQKVLYLNGEPYEEPYVVTTEAPDEFDPIMRWQREYLVGEATDDYLPTRDNWGPIAIPAGMHLMLGDNRDASYDSRYWGLLEGWRFEGRAVAIYYSYDSESMRPFPWVREIRAGRIFDRIR